jgi:putative transposase
MKRGRFTEEQIIGVLREQEAGLRTADLCRKHGISEATFYAWKGRWCTDAGDQSVIAPLARRSHGAS